MHRTCLLIVVSGFLAAPCLAAGGVDRVVAKGQKVKPEYAKDRGWAKGVLTLVNDSQRSDGWQSWFTGHSHLPEYFEFSPRSEKEVQQLIDKFAEIEFADLRIRFEKGKEPKSIGLMGGVKRNILKLAEQQSTRVGPVNEIYGGKGTTALFSIGERRTIELARKERIPPKVLDQLACFPTLRLYVGNDFIDPKRLKIPKNVRVIEP